MWWLNTYHENPRSHARHISCSWQHNGFGYPLNGFYIGFTKTSDDIPPNPTTAHWNLDNIGKGYHWMDGTSIE